MKLKNSSSQVTWSYRHYWIISPKNMTWNDRWETKLFLGGQITARWNGTEMNNLNQVQSSWRYHVSPDFEQEVVFYFLSHSCMYSAVRPVFFRNLEFFSKLELLRTTTPPVPSPSLSKLSFGLINNNFRTVTKWNLKWHFILLFLKSSFIFPDSQECFERKGSSVGVFHDSACGLTSPPVLHHGRKIWSERVKQ